MSKTLNMDQLHSNDDTNNTREGGNGIFIDQIVGLVIPFLGIRDVGRLEACCQSAKPVPSPFWADLAMVHQNWKLPKEACGYQNKQLAERFVRMRSYAHRMKDGALQENYRTEFPGECSFNVGLDTLEECCTFPERYHFFLLVVHEGQVVHEGFVPTMAQQQVQSRSSSQATTAQSDNVIQLKLEADFSVAGWEDSELRYLLGQGFQWNLVKHNTHVIVCCSKQGGLPSDTFLVTANSPTYGTPLNDPPGVCHLTHMSVVAHDERCLHWKVLVCLHHRNDHCHTVELVLSGRDDDLPPRPI